MKNRLLFSFCIIILFAISACSKKSDDTTPTPPAPTNTTPTYFLKYKFNGTQISADSLSVFRDTTSNPRLMIITGTVKTSPYLPKIQIVLEETIIGWVNGLNVHCYSASTQSYVQARDLSNAVYNTLSATNGINLFFSHLSYVKNNVITGTFSGELQAVTTSSIVPITEGSFNMVIAN
jgi:hypothetical protein